jgi:hypothetical protein
MLAGERPGRGTTPGTGTELNDATHASTPGRIGEGLGRGRAITRNLLGVLLELFRLEPWPSPHGGVISSRPCPAPRVIRRAMRSRGLTGRRKRHTRPGPQVQDPRPSNQPPGPCRHPAEGEAENTGAPA